MKKAISILLSAAIISASFAVPVLADDDAGETISYNYMYSAGNGYTDENTHNRVMEKLDRGLVAVKTSGGVYLSWRLSDSEDTRYGSAKSNVSFNVYRDGEKIAEVSDSTNYTDTAAGTSYCVAPVVDGTEGEMCSPVSPLSDNYFDIPLDKPTRGESSIDADYSVGDCSAGDVDGDGEYEIIVKWDCNPQDNSNGGVTGNVLLDAYKTDGTRLWRIDLGRNIRSGAHYTQFLVYDFDGDGLSELACKTAPGSKDGLGNYVTKASKDAEIAAMTDEDNEQVYINSGGYILSGPEFYTVFGGLTGETIDTIYYPFPRGTVSSWGDSYGNRVDRFLGTVAYLDGVHPYIISVRGYYTRTTVAAMRLENGTLTVEKTFDSNKAGTKYNGQGNHNITVADVDNDGRDEVITGAICWDDDLSLKWCSGRGHGDALHIGDYDPTHEGLEYFSVHESGGYTISSSTTSSQGKTADYGMTVYDADTGEELFHKGASDDTGRGVMANIGSGGYYQISSGAGTYQSNGLTSFSSSKSGPGSNFRVFWDGDLYDEILDGTNISDWNGSKVSGIFSADGCVRINGTKANPALQADLFGDWREELVYPTSDNASVRVFTTTIPTEYKIKTLMQDPVYRSGVAAEQTAYNQPPHVGFYMGGEMFESAPERLEIITPPAKTVYTQGEELDASGLEVKVYLEDGTSKTVNAYSVTGYDPYTVGEQDITVTYSGASASFTVTVKEMTGIGIVSFPSKTEFAEGQSINTSGLVVHAYYADGTHKEITGYKISGYDSSVLGSQTVTIEYLGKICSFEVIVKPGDVSALNGDYKTDSSEKSSIPVGSFSGSFILEHSVRINSMPADGNADKNNTDGFFLRFTANGQTGGGWYLTRKSDTQMNLLWKNTKSQKITALNVGEAYTFKYEFSEVGSGSGALVTLSVINSSGETVSSAEGLNLRNFSDTDSGKKSPITGIEIYNQANDGSSSDVKINNAKIYANAEIVSVYDKKVSLSIGSLSNLKIYAAKYNDDGTLYAVDELNPSGTGDRTMTAAFEPDKVFIWSGQLMPIDFWENKP